MKKYFLWSILASISVIGSSLVFANEDFYLDESHKNLSDSLIYHHFVSDDWEDLLPLSSAKDFLDSPKATATYLSSTYEKNPELYLDGCYLRTIVKTADESKDSNRLSLSEMISMKTVRYSPEISHKVWREVKPYLLPERHPLKERLDKICKSRRILASYESLEKSGFNIIYKQLDQGLVVAKHSLLPGYLIKLYLDSSPRIEWPLWVLRAKGARVIQGLINKYNYNKFMKVPVKWIYPVTHRRRPKANATTFPKDFILIVKDVDLCSNEVTLAKLNYEMTFSQLQALHNIILAGGLSDSHVGNIPFSNDGRIAFIDTEYFNVWPVHLDWLTKYFSPSNQIHWNRLSEGM